jgi:hypothetical protein
MFKFAADENFHGDLLRGLLRRFHELDIVRIQDTEMAQASDPDILAWAAEEGRILLTHDAQTRIGYTYDRIRQNQPVPGVFEIQLEETFSSILESLTLIIEVSDPSEWADRVTYIPLR